MTPASSHDELNTAAAVIGEREIVDTETQISRADNKAASLIGAVSVLGLLVGLFLAAKNHTILTNIVGIGGLLPFVGALLSAISGLRPRTKGVPPVEDSAATTAWLIARAVKTEYNLAVVSQQLSSRRAVLQVKNRRIVMGLRLFTVAVALVLTAVVINQVTG